MTCTKCLSCVYDTTREVCQKLHEVTRRTNTEFPTVPVDYQEAEPYRRAAHQSTSLGRIWCSSSKLLLLPSSHPTQVFSVSSSVGERCRTSSCSWVSLCPSLSYEGILIGFRAQCELIGLVMIMHPQALAKFWGSGWVCTQRCKHRSVVADLQSRWLFLQLGEPKGTDVCVAVPTLMSWFLIPLSD